LGHGERFQGTRGHKAAYGRSRAHEAKTARGYEGREEGEESEVEEEAKK